MKYILFLISVIMGVQVATAQDAAIRTRHFNHVKGLAIDGYDPVAYFTAHAAQKGSSKFAHTFGGITYYFATPQNLQTFKANPTAYEPQYGGWCAYAMGNTGEKIPVDPNTFKIVNGKLYLFYNKWLNNTLTSWNKNENQLNKNADANWKNIFR
ncbi:YHS domain protein [Sphingobacteriales bacterium UPWRP_1]|nr:YHS domain protein [Sphingobacteriales bacterium TSM_CSS]PSJ77162.1 YHS domain protein [Sphingobacteriales bacterium UPWRP_1]